MHLHSFVIFYLLSYVYILLLEHINIHLPETVDYALYDHTQGYSHSPPLLLQLKNDEKMNGYCIANEKKNKTIFKSNISPFRI